MLDGLPFAVHFGRWRGRNRWPLAHVRNVAAAVFLAATRPEAAGRAMNVLDDERVSADGFYRRVAETFRPDRRYRSITLPFCLGEALGVAFGTVSDLLDRAEPVADPTRYGAWFANRNLDFDNARYRSLMTAAGRTPVTLEAGLRELRESDSTVYASVLSDSAATAGGREKRTSAYFTTLTNSTRKIRSMPGLIGPPGRGRSP
jgi:nucleoside-diphosphate-sugar epimerase